MIERNRFTMKRIKREDIQFKTQKKYLKDIGYTIYRQKERRCTIKKIEREKDIQSDRQKKNDRTTWFLAPRHYS